ncbi:MAG: hypothetical protein A3F70_18965 [Acidobacteria bacterium RIFCSPLOWO2_12_FULL_67_14]|nr:MAG: hypothetical protein A3H29_04905 [Acidobacteria bacterium RIFCSPLOWO2_02_FULL_67_21]OFW35744.1 MAG: hypothetical protein A3F70_18965 [Acidobacteria bacterium RIFCSPLOWO2_12_FULL_67_14]
MATLLQNLSIKRKLTLVTMITSCAALLVACALFGVYDYTMYRQTQVRRAVMMANIVGGNSTAALSFDDRDAASTILGSLREQPGIRTAVIFDTVGQPFTSFVDPGWPGANCQGVAGVRYTSIALIVQMPIALAGDRIGLICLQSDLSSLHERLTRSPFPADTRRMRRTAAFPSTHTDAWRRF